MFIKRKRGRDPERTHEREAGAVDKRHIHCGQRLFCLDRNLITCSQDDIALLRRKSFPEIPTSQKEDKGQY